MGLLSYAFFLVHMAKPILASAIAESDAGAAEFLPRHLSLESLRDAAGDCKGCDLEDREGKPFVGPAGRILDEALESAGLSRASLKVTQHRGKVMESPFAVPVVATVHPSSILRAADDAARRSAMEAFVSDLQPVARLLRKSS